MAEPPRATAPDPKPEPPREPEPGECCQSGCDPCVFDRYWDALDRYERALREWTLRQSGGKDR
jgi:hypothetical protein